MNSQTQFATMPPDRQSELRSLLDIVRQHPERALTRERQRIAILQRQLAAKEAATRH
ncbi:MAG: hypothetical protein ACK5NN_09495 [Sphingomonadaceae bacterium]